MTRDRMQRTNVFLDALKKEAQAGHLSSQSVAILLIQEIENRMNEDTALFEIMQSLAEKIDYLLERVPTHEIPDTRHGQTGHFVLSATKGFWYTD